MRERNGKTKRDILEPDINKYVLEIRDPKRTWLFRGSVPLILATIIGLAWIGDVSAEKTPLMFILCVLAIITFGVVVKVCELRNKSD